MPGGKKMNDEPRIEMVDARAALRGLPDARISPAAPNAQAALRAAEQAAKEAQDALAAARETARAEQLDAWARQEQALVQERREAREKWERENPELVGIKEALEVIRQPSRPAERRAPIYPRPYAVGATSIGYGFGGTMMHHRPFTGPGYDY
jgi:hypothetical protein